MPDPQEQRPTAERSSASWSIESGASLLEVDPLAASAHLERAMELTGRPSAELVALLGQAYVWTNRAAEAITLIEGWRPTAGAVDEVAAEAGDGRLRLVNAQALAALGDLGAAALAFELALELDTEAPAWQRAFAEAQILRAMVFQNALALDNVEHLLGCAHVDPLAEVHARCARSWVYKNEGRVDEAIIEARIALDIERPEDLRFARSPSIFLADALLTGDRLDEFDVTIRSARLEVLHHGDVWQVPALASMVTGAELRRGNWKRAWAEADGGISWANATGNRLALPWLLSLQSAIASWRGRPEMADSLLVAAETELAEGHRSGVEVVLWARAVQASMVGAVDEAAELFLSIWRLAIDLGLRARLPMLGPDVLRSVLGAGDREAALTIARALDDLDASIACLGPCRSLARGLLEESPEALIIASAGYARLGLRLDAAMALADGAVLEHRRGGGGSLVARARRLQAELGADGLRTRLDASIPGAEPIGTTTASALDLLSGAERRVAELVATGVSNPAVAAELHISRRTVESHLSHIFSKLGISSRVELALMVVAEDP